MLSRKIQIQKLGHMIWINEETQYPMDIHPTPELVNNILK